MRFARRIVATQAAALAVAVFASVAGLAAPASVAGAGSISSSVVIEPTEFNPKPVGRTTDLVAMVSPSDATGSVGFFDDQGGSRVLIGSAPVTNSLAGPGLATFTAPADMATGTYHLVAVYSGDGTYAGSESSPAYTLVVGPRPVSVTLTISGPHDASGLSGQRGDTLTAIVWVADQGQYTPNAPQMTGKVTVSVDNGAHVAGPVTLSGQGGGTVQLALPTSTWALGSRSIVATLDAGVSQDYLGGASSPWDVNLIANQVDATGIGVKYATFYPYRDGFRDSNAIRGVRNEPASVSIRVYSAKNALVKSAAVGLGSGPYAVPWTGRNAAGTMLAAGKYRVVQVLTDALKAKRTVTTYVVLSAKRLYRYTASITKKGSQYSLAERGGVTASLTGGWAKWVGSASQGSGVAWEFTLPSAITYTSISFRVEARTLDGSMQLQNFVNCGGFAWVANCFGPMGASIGNSIPTLAWYSFTGSASLNRSGRLVRGLVDAYEKPVSVYLAQVRVVYTLLK